MQEMISNIDCGDGSIIFSAEGLKIRGYCSLPVFWCRLSLHGEWGKFTALDWESHTKLAEFKLTETIKRKPDCAPSIEFGNIGSVLYFGRQSTDMLSPAERQLIIEGWRQDRAAPSL